MKNMKETLFQEEDILDQIFIKAIMVVLQTFTVTVQNQFRPHNNNLKKENSWLEEDKFA